MTGKRNSKKEHAQQRSSLGEGRCDIVKEAGEKGKKEWGRGGSSGCDRGKVYGLDLRTTDESSQVETALF